ncbi:MAG: Lactate utilization protein C [Betaproteobacteria bacterium ADurb.Bin341]|nr:MAG: Lactate utilization protein C [Betaproteobacteria bacterium ADurb.Bin341]
MSVAVRGAADADLVGLTDCFCAIAETGTLMLHSAPDLPPTLSLLPETHVAVVPLERIVPTMEEAFARFRAQFSDMPPAVNFISGPSRTADIEQTIVLGAHGPCRVHVVLVG